MLAAARCNPRIWFCWSPHPCKQDEERQWVREWVNDRRRRKVNLLTFIPLTNASGGTAPFISDGDGTLTRCVKLRLSLCFLHRAAGLVRCSPRTLYDAPFLMYHPIYPTSAWWRAPESDTVVNFMSMWAALSPRLLIVTVEGTRWYREN